MYQHIDVLAAQSMAHERERDLQAALRQRQGEAARTPAVNAPEQPTHHHWLHGLLVRAHLTPATP